MLHRALIGSSLSFRCCLTRSAGPKRVSETKGMPWHSFLLVTRTLSWPHACQWHCHVRAHLSSSCRNFCCCCRIVTVFLACTQGAGSHLTSTDAVIDKPLSSQHCPYNTVKTPPSALGRSEVLEWQIHAAALQVPAPKMQCSKVWGKL